MSRKTLLALSAVAALCVFASLSISARAAGQDGMVVVRDPQTGKMRSPTANEMKALQAATPAGASMAPRTPTPPVIMRSDGSRGVNVGETHRIYEVVTRGEDGKLSRHCVQGDAAAQEALTHPAGAHMHKHEAKESDHESR